MGKDALAVVDDRLRVRAVEALRVADASVFPNITSGNTNSPVITVAGKASSIMHEQHGTG
jgi:choline dehydrogenase